jgi:hypothetical protein
VVDPFKGIRTIVEELEKYNPKWENIQNNECWTHKY